MLITYKYRIKDSTSRKVLCALSNNVNFIWNYINKLFIISNENYKKGFNTHIRSSYDIDKYLVGASKEFDLHSQTLQSISKSYFYNKNILHTNKFGKKYKKAYLSWRSYKRSLGWIPFKDSGFKFKDDTVEYCSKVFKIYKSRSLPQDAVIKCGSFNQDSRGRWYVNITFSIPDVVTCINKDNSVGIDLGIKEALILSDGTTYARPNLTKRYEEELALAQRAGKKNRVKKIHAKIRNTRKDYFHKVTTEIAKQFNVIYIGDVKSQDIIDKDLSKNMTKGVYDAGWYMVKDLLKYKAIKLGGSCKEVDEAYTTQDCNNCLSRVGPRGTEGLSIRVWTCTSCGITHDRDVNSARNILRIGHDTP